MNFFSALGSFDFLMHALLGGLLASIACGIVGAFVVVRRIGYMAGGIAHTVLGGMGIAYYLGHPPMGGALISALIAAFIISAVSRHAAEQEDTIISALWAVGMATGVLFIAKTPGYNVDLMSYLFGNVLMISQQDLLFIAILDVAIIAITLLFYRQLVLVCFDPEFATIRGIPVAAVHTLLLCMVALTVVILIQIVGLILVIAMLTLPAASARLFSTSLALMMLIATLLGGMLTSIGLGLSFTWDLPAGASTAVLSGIAYLVALGAKKMWQARAKSRSQRKGFGAGLSS
ncbi:MAG: metal ABC transporter permease [Desulfuromonadaceae bacterium]|nr:metal ABC transporter permease [Geobacteraceae bacterium]